MRRSFYQGRNYPKPTKTFDEIDEILQNHPLGQLEGYWGETANATSRHALAEQINAKIYWEGPLSEELVAFYRKRIKRALNEVESIPPPEDGVIVWKMYNCGTILKSREGTFGFDVVEGPIPTIPILPENLLTLHKLYDLEGREVEGYLPQFAEEFETGPIPDPTELPTLHWNSIHLCRHKLFWTPQMRSQYTKVIDAHFVSHHHYDHFEVMLTKKILEARKLVVAPSEIRQKCIYWGFNGADKIQTLPQTQSPESKEYRVEGTRVINYAGYQDEYYPEENSWRTGHAGRVIWRFNPAAPEMHVYTLKLGGFAVLVTGEVRGCPSFYPWLLNLRQTEWQPDLVLLMLPSLHNALLKLSNPIFIRLHNWEFGHTFLQVWKKDMRPYLYLYERCGDDLFWGERFLIKPKF
jgi:hypothetical protein